MVSERSLAVLHAIVSDFVTDGEPVGSKSIVERHGLGVSAATIRNDMTLLEEEELIAAPHTSSGRIPTDKGYRLYVDTLAKIRPLSNAQRNAISRFLGESLNLDDMMMRTVRLLANLTNQVAVVQYPVTSTLRVRHLELIPIATDSILVVTLTNSARVDQSVIKLQHESPGEEQLASLRATLNEALGGLLYSEAGLVTNKLLASSEEFHEGTPHEVLKSILQNLQSQFDSEADSRITVAGTGNLARTGETYTDLTAMLDAVEEQVTLLRLIQELVAGQHGVGVSIGRENLRYGLPESTLLAADYTQGYDANAKLGVFGPTRMDYAKNIAAVRAVSRYLGKFLGEN